jgi:uncharacterized protein YndB with AHSA1/START domain/predicted SnoaL-like aldol condensation-catalyzing enzyme
MRVAMPSIIHQLTIKCSVDRIYQALTEQQGLAGWWTTDVVAEPTAGSVAEFGFSNRRTVIRMRVEEIVPASLVAWRCLGGIEEWSQTSLRFELKRDGNETILVFRHQEWMSSDGVLPLCSFDWARYLMSLRSLVETGHGNPHRATSEEHDQASPAEANKELVRRLYGSLMANGDTAAADAILASGYADHDIPGRPGGGGREELKAAVLGVRAAFPNIQPELYEMAGDADWVAVRVEASGTHSGTPFLGVQPSGKHMRWKEVHFFRCASGKIVEHRGVFDLLSILRQLGALPAD